MKRPVANQRHQRQRWAADTSAARYLVELVREQETDGGGQLAVLLLDDVLHRQLLEVDIRERHRRNLQILRGIQARCEFRDISSFGKAPGRVRRRGAAA